MVPVALGVIVLLLVWFKLIDCHRELVKIRNKLS
jgi:hypothetical protein